LRTYHMRTSGLLSEYQKAVVDVKPWRYDF
jgi:hypothetical protein